MPPTRRNQGKRTGDKMEDIRRDAYFGLQTMHNILKNGFDGTVDPKASVFLLGVMQYLATELIEVSGNAARETVSPGEPFVITPKDILKGIESDKELKELFSGQTKALARKAKEKH